MQPAVLRLKLPAGKDYESDQGAIRNWCFAHLEQRHRMGGCTRCSAEGAGAARDHFQS